MRNTETKRQTHSPSEKASIPQSSPGVSSEFRTRKGEKSPTASAALGRRKESTARVGAQPPTHFNAAGHLGHLGASRPSSIPNQCAPAHPTRTHLQSRCPRRRRAHSAGATGRTAARREEPCGCGPGGRRAPSSGLQARLGRDRGSGRPPPPPPPPTPASQPPAARSRPPARRRRLDRWLQAPEAAGGRAKRPTRQRPQCQLPAGRSASASTLRDGPGARRGDYGAGRGWAHWRGGAGRGSEQGAQSARGRGTGRGSEVPRGARAGAPGALGACPLSLFGSPGVTALTFLGSSAALYLTAPLTLLVSRATGPMGCPTAFGWEIVNTPPPPPAPRGSPFSPSGLDGPSILPPFESIHCGV